MKYVPENLEKYFAETCGRFNINTPLRQAHFLAQVTHESLDFHYREENLNYSAKGLSSTWANKFAERGPDGKPIKGTPNQLALSIQHNPEKIANLAYASKDGNGDETTGDGWRYRGRGFIQLTRKNNYVAFSQDVDPEIINNPDLVSTDKYAMLSAGWYWEKNNLNAIADEGPTDEVVTKITHVVNGGENGLSDRKARFHNIYNELKT